MKVFAYMECGSGKQVSEDTMLLNGMILKEGFHTFDTQGRCAAIADGVGGIPGGRFASEFVMDKCKDILADEDPRSVFLGINNDLLSYAKSIAGMERMATTLSAVLFSSEVPATIVHIGNTRIFAIQGIYLKQLSNDHTTAEFLRARGDFESAEKAPKNEITACMGGGLHSRIAQLQTEELGKEYAGFIITSDGVHDFLEVEILEDFIAAGDFSQESFQRLFQKARENGSDDDKSMIVLRAEE